METHRPEAVPAADPRPPVPAPKGPVARLVDRVLELGPVRWSIPLLAHYDAAGGGLLASGLAFNSLFAILPFILLLVAVVGVFLGDASRLAAVSASLSLSFPPLAGFFDVALGGFARGAIAYSVVGLVALIWGASRFSQSLDDAMARIFESTRRRDPLQRGLLGVFSVFLLAAVIGALVVASSFVTSVGGDGLRNVPLASALVSSTIGAGLASVLLFIGGIALIYRLVPTNRPSWRMIRRPAVVVGAFGAIFTSLFTVLTPQLVGSLQIYGAFVAVFAAMIWLSFVSQVLLIGAAWVHLRVIKAGVHAARREAADDSPPSAHVIGAAHRQVPDPAEPVRTTARGRRTT
jgi:membrane protein